tara:strand:- start:33967 stop:34758 length:792 start_codon:yes stop_codon:yes gene_type:complete
MLLPEIDPIAFAIGPVVVRWYGITWAAAFGLIYLLASKNLSKFSKDQLENLMFYGLLGAVIGGRIGYMFFYSIEQVILNPLSIFYFWEGGMSFHGGLIGVLLACFILSKSWGCKFFEIMDFIAPYVPIGLGTVRVGNFLNSELLGKPTEMPWGVIFPSDPLGLVRHASQLYQAIGEGIIFLLLMIWFSRKPKPLMAVSSMFLIGYGVVRCLTEIFREPDAHIGFDLLGAISRGQLLSIPMIIIGLMLLFYSYKKTQGKDAAIS